jgi:hypothetical protein
MQIHTDKLWQLATEIFAPNEAVTLKKLVESVPFDAILLQKFDDSLPGPSLSRMNCKNEGRYEIADRDIFRPLQYCGMHFGIAIKGNWDDDSLWQMRSVVQMSSLHIEGLIKNIGSVFHLPLGAALRKAIVKAKVDALTWAQIEDYTHIYNDAKHNFGHEKDTHMFSIEDAVLAYFVCRKLGVKLYPLADLATDITIFEKECDEAEISHMPQWILDYHNKASSR